MWAARRGCRRARLVTAAAIVLGEGDPTRALALSVQVQVEPTLVHVHAPVAGPLAESLTPHLPCNVPWVLPLPALCALGGVWWRPAEPTVAAAAPGQQRPRRVTDPAALIEAGDYVRIHFNPRRYPRSWTTDWSAAVVLRGLDAHQRACFAVVEKPRGVPVHPAVDNAVENVVARVQDSLRRAGSGAPPPYVQAPHRLDTDTSGLLVLALDEGFCQRFGALLQDAAGRHIRKRYRCLVELQDGAPGLRVGRRLEHQLVVSPKSPKQFLPAPGAEGVLPPPPTEDSPGQPPCKVQHCALKVVRASPPARVRRAAVLRASAAALDGGGAEEPCAEAGEMQEAEVQEVEVELETGRTHQIRGQLAATPGVRRIFGDEMYGEGGPAPGSGFKTSPHLALQACRLEFPSLGALPARGASDSDWDPMGTACAWSATGADGRVVVELPRAWWSGLLE